MLNWWGNLIYNTRSIWKKRNRTTIIAGLNCKNDIIASIYFKGNTNTEIFINWLKEYLLPKLKVNQVIIMDNASFHKSNKIKEIIESYGCRLIFLPPYSPDFNPIEKYWSFLKNKLKKLALYCSDFFKNLNEVLNMKYVKVDRWFSITPGRADPELQKDIINKMINSRQEVKDFIDSVKPSNYISPVDYVFDNLK